MFYHVRFGPLGGIALAIVAGTLKLRAALPADLRANWVT